MATARVGVRRSRNVRPWWRPVVFSAVAATIAALLQPVPAATNPALQQIEKGRNDIAALGDKLIQAEQDRDLAQAQVEAARLKYQQAQKNLEQAQAAAADAAAQAVIDAAALPPGGLGGANSLDDLARLQRGQGTAQAIARQIELAQIPAQLSPDEQPMS